MIHLISLTTALTALASLAWAGDKPIDPVAPLPAPLPFLTSIVTVPQENILATQQQYRASAAEEPGDPVVPLPAPLPYHASIVFVPQEDFGLDWRNHLGAVADEPIDPVFPLPAPLPFITSTIAIPHDIIGLDWRKYLGAASEEPGDPVVPLPAPLPFLTKVPPTPVGIWADPEDMPPECKKPPLPEFCLVSSVMDVRSEATVLSTIMTKGLPWLHTKELMPGTVNIFGGRGRVDRIIPISH